MAADSSEAGRGRPVQATQGAAESLGGGATGWTGDHRWLESDQPVQVLPARARG